MLLSRRKILFSLLTCASLLRNPASCAFSMSSSRVVNPEKFLFYDYELRGKEVTTQDNLSVYCSGQHGSKNGVLVIPDSLGWNGGRVRNIADYFGDNKCLAVVPSIIGMSMGMERVTNFMESPSIRDYFKSVTFDGGIKPKICSAIQYMRNEGVEKIAIIGFSWGGWVVTNILASDLAENFVCGALPHPSIDLEERLFGGSVIDLMSRINRPILLMPSQGDPDKYVELMRLLKFKLPSSDVISYNHISNNFLHRGSTSSPEIKQASEEALQRIMSFFNDHFQMDVNQLVSQSAKGGFTREFQQPKSLYEQSKEAGEHLAQRVQQGAGDLSERTKQTSQDIGERTHQTAQVLSERAQGTYDVTKETVEPYVDSAKQTGESFVERLQHAGQYVAEQARSTFDYVKGGVNSAGESAQETREYLGDQAQQTYDKAKENVSGAAERTKQTGQQVGEQAQQTYEKAKDTISQTGQKVGEQAQQTYEKAKNNVSQTGQKVGEQAQQTYDWAKEGMSNAGERAKQTGQQVGEQAQQTYDKAKDTATQARQQAGDKAQQAYDKTKQAASQTSDQAKQTYQATKDKAKQTGQNVSDQAHQTYDKAKDNTGKASEKAKDTASEAGKQVGEKTKQAGEEIKHRSERGHDKK